MKDASTAFVALTFCSVGGGRSTFWQRTSSVVRKISWINLKMSRIFGIVPFALGLVVFCVWIPTPGFALKCHVCNSLTNETCDFLKDDRYLVDCNSLDTGEKQNYTNCRKEAFSASSAKFDMYTKRTIRSCGIERHYRSSCFYSSNIDLKGSTCECEEDGCNGGSVLHSVARIILTVVLCGFLASVLTT